jgi:predicted kinase
MPELLMLIGVPGSGKSTWITNQGYWDHKTVMILSTDNFIQSVANGEKKTYSEVFTKAIKPAEDHLKYCLKVAIDSGMTIAWDQTNLSAPTRCKKMQQIPSFYRKIACVFPIPDTETHNAWLNSPERKGKVIPQHIMDSMIATFQYPTKPEGFDEIRDIILT